MMKISIKVIPNSKLNSVVSKDAAGWKIKLTAPAVDGKANQALIDFLSEELSVPRRNINIIRGKTSRNKFVEIIE